MDNPHQSFSSGVQKEALARQEFLCASCTCVISKPGRKGQQEHFFGESAEGHHVIPHKKLGPLTVENCVVLCRACHRSAHQGSRWRDVSIYDDIAEPPTLGDIEKIANLYPHYKGCRCKPRCDQLQKLR